MHNCRTQTQHVVVLIIFPLYLRTTTIPQMMSTGLRAVSTNDYWPGSLMSVLVDRGPVFTGVRRCIGCCCCGCWYDLCIVVWASSTWSTRDSCDGTDWLDTNRRPANHTPAQPVLSSHWVQCLWLRLHQSFSPVYRGRADVVSEGQGLSAYCMSAGWLCAVSSYISAAGAISLHYLLSENYMHTFANLMTAHTHTHTRLTALFSGTTQVSWYQKGKTNLDFTEARDNEWQWHQLDHMQVCTWLHTDNHASTHHSVFYRPDALPAAQPTASKHWRHLMTAQLNSIRTVWLNRKYRAVRKNFRDQREDLTETSPDTVC